MVSFAGALCWQRGLFLGGRGSVDCEVEEQTQPGKIINIYSVGADWEQGCSGTLSAHYLSKSSAVICLEVCFAQKKKMEQNFLACVPDNQSCHVSPGASPDPVVLSSL